MIELKYEYCLRQQVFKWQGSREKKSMELLFLLVPREKTSVIVFLF